MFFRYVFEVSHETLFEEMTGIPRDNFRGVAEGADTAATLQFTFFC